MQVLTSGALYFALVFGAGFVLGTLRVLLLEPLLGVRFAVLLEIPVMLAVVYFAAGFVVAKMPAACSRADCLGAGAVALGLLLLCEFTLVLAVRGLSLEQYMASRDAVATVAYAGSLVVFMLMPWLRGADPAE